MTLKQYLVLTAISLPALFAPDGLLTGIAVGLATGISFLYGKACHEA